MADKFSRGDLIDMVTDASASQTVAQLGKSHLLCEMVGGPYDGAVLPVFIPVDVTERGIEIFLPLTLPDPDTGEADYAWYKLKSVVSAEACFLRESRTANPAGD